MYVLLVTRLVSGDNSSSSICRNIYIKLLHSRSQCSETIPHLYSWCPFRVLTVWQLMLSSARSEATTPLSLFPPCVFPFLSRAGALEKTLLPSRNTVFWVVIFHLEPPIPSYNGEYQHTSGQQTPTKPSPRLSHKTKRTFDLIWIVFNSRVPFFFKYKTELLKHTLILSFLLFLTLL